MSVGMRLIKMISDAKIPSWGADFDKGRWKKIFSFSRKWWELNFF